jgi:hypothetical protein
LTGRIFCPRRFRRQAVVLFQRRGRDVESGGANGVAGAGFEPAVRRLPDYERVGRGRPVIA